MRRCILHIGSGKTATTTLQKTLAANRDALARNGIIYPGNDSNHHHLSLILLPESFRPREYNPLTPEEINKTRDLFWKNICKSLFNEKYHTCILSTEYLFTDSNYTIAKTAEILGNYFDEIEIVAVVRDPIAFYTSFCQQMIKARSIPPDPRIFRYNFLECIAAWKEKFPTRVYIYKKKEDFVIRLIKSLLPINLNFKMVPPQNKSLTIEQLSVLEKIQDTFYADFEDVFKPHLGLIYEFRPSSGSKLTLKEPIKALIRKNHTKEIAWLEKNAPGEFFPSANEQCEPEVKLPTIPSLKDIFVQNKDSLQKYEIMIINEMLKIIHLAKNKKE